jgi:hypothetical protein
MSEFEPAVVDATNDEAAGGSAEPERAHVSPHCKCGTTRDSKYCVPEREYSLLGTLYMIWGGTSTPTKIKFRCILCQREFDETTAPSVCFEFRNQG